MIVAEVVEVNKAYKSNQKDENGDPLPLGSIQVRIGAHQTNLGQVRNFWVRPAGWNLRIPLIGESVYLVTAPVNDWSSSSVKNVGYLYVAPLNSTDDMAQGKFPKLWKRGNNVGGGGSGQRNADKEKNYTFPDSPTRVFPIQPFEGDSLWQSRTGASLRFGTTIQGGDQSVYDQKPTWKGSKNADPILILRLKKPEGGASSAVSSLNIFKSSENKYTIEDLSKDESSIYMTTNQTLSKLKGGFDKNLEVKKLGNFQGKSQIVVDSDRVVINAKKDILFLIGATQTIVTGKKILLQTERHKIDIDDLMDFLKKWLGEDVKLATASSQYSTSSGPSGPATSAAQYIQLQSTDFTKFKQP